MVTVMFMKYLFMQIRKSVCFGYVGHSVMSRKSVNITYFTCYVSDMGHCIMLHLIYFIFQLGSGLVASVVNMGGDRIFSQGER
jgi:hypothetical protein